MAGDEHWAIGPHVLPGRSGGVIAPTGEEVTWTATTLHRLVNGRLAAGWVNADLLGLLRQLRVPPLLAASGQP